MTAPNGRKRQRKQRATMAAIRATWTAVFIGVSFAVDYLADIDRLREFGLAIPLAIAIGAGLYGAKKYFWPDTMW